MTSSKAHGPSGANSFDLKDVRILLVEDSWSIGMAMKRLLRALGAEVIGPAATTAEAEQLISERVPAVALVDIHLRGGELAYSLIDRLHDQGVRVVVISGYGNLRLAPGKVAAILQKPIRQEQLLEALRSDEDSLAWGSPAMVVTPVR
jgi:DNA-binding NtrC family response regulator